MAEIRYEWTGEYRPPKRGEWFLSGDDARRVGGGFENVMPYFILRRVEESGVNDKKTQPCFCTWAWDEHHCYYETSCDNSFCFSYGKKDSGFIYCPYCARVINDRVEASDSPESEVKDG